MSKSLAERQGQGIQTSMYGFPYHHLVQLDETYALKSLSRTMPAGLRYAAYMNLVLEHVQLLSPQSVIDIGCGDGFFTNALAARSQEIDVYGVDLSPEAIALANALKASPQVTLDCYDIIATPPGKRHDVATLIEVLEHIPLDMIDDFVAAVGRLVRPGGHLIVTVPSRNLPIENIKRHYQHFLIPGLNKTLESAFEPVVAEYINSSNFGAKSLEKVLYNRAFTVNHPRVNSVVYKMYESRYLHSNESEGLRVFGVYRRYSG